MSSFEGRMKEYERISLDRFNGKNLQSTVYFLSHLHEDHTVGLATSVFQKRLKTSKNVFLYCSEVTEVLIKASRKYRHLVPYIRKLEINTPTTIEIPDPLFDEIETVTVTFLPAFHCPGSVMCLFEGHEGTVLYTGDFRWEHFHIEQMLHLRSGENVKKVKSLYIDTTFCTPENLYIPSRQHCIDATYQLVYEWISQSPQHVVYMSLRSQYGHEPLLNAVASRLNKKVHVESHKVEVYNQIHEFHGNFTSDGSATQIHACGKELQNIDGEYLLCRKRHDPDKVLDILPTTMYFTQFQHLTLDKIVRKVGNSSYRVCYSFHSSYTELKDLISYLKPDNVYPNVIPPSDPSLDVVQHRLNTMLTECLSTASAGDGGQEAEVKELGTLKTQSSSRVLRKRKQSTPSDPGSLDFGTPPKAQKRDTETEHQTRIRGCKAAIESSQESESDTTPSKDRGQGRKTRSGQNLAEPATKRVSTRLRSKQTKKGEHSQPKTPVKHQKSDSPDIFLTPSKSEMSEKQSSYSGSHGDDSEIDLTLSQKSLDLDFLEMKEDPIDTWKGGSFLSAVSSHSDDDACVILYEEIELADENYEDASEIEAECQAEDGFTSEDLENTSSDEKTTREEDSSKKTPERKTRKSKGNLSKSNKDRKTCKDTTETNRLSGQVDQSEASTEESDRTVEKSKKEIEEFEKSITETQSVVPGQNNRKRKQNEVYALKKSPRQKKSEAVKESEQSESSKDTDSKKVHDIVEIDKTQKTEENEKNHNVVEHERTHDTNEDAKREKERCENSAEVTDDNLCIKVCEDLSVVTKSTQNSDKQSESKNDFEVEISVELKEGPEKIEKLSENEKIAERLEKLADGIGVEYLVKLVDKDNTSLLESLKESNTVVSALEDEDLESGIKNDKTDKFFATPAKTTIDEPNGAFELQGDEFYEEDIAKAIIESMECDDSFENADDDHGGINCSDESDIIEDTPPGERSVSETQINSSIPYSVKQSTPKPQTNTEHWPVSPGLSNQEQRGRKKQKQNKRKDAALHGEKDNDSDCEIIIKDEPKVEIDLTVRKEYNENDFEYDMYKKHKQAKKEVGVCPEDQLITVFKTEKIDDYLYGKVTYHDVLKKEKIVKRLRYTRRRSFDLAEETPEDSEFIVELEAALVRKEGPESGVKNENSKQTADDVTDEKYLNYENDRFLEVLKDKEGNDTNTEKDIIETSRKASVKHIEDGKAVDVCDSAEKIEMEQMELESINDEKVETQKDSANPVREGELKKDSEKQKQNNIQYTETKEGKKLMRISLSGKRKRDIMPRQNYLGNEIFIDLSNEDETTDITDSSQNAAIRKVEEEDCRNKITQNTSSPDSNNAKQNRNNDKNCSNSEAAQEDSPSGKVAKMSVMKDDKIDHSNKSNEDNLEAEITEVNEKLNNSISKQMKWQEDHTNIVHVEDENILSSSDDSGEWLSCSKAKNNKKVNFKKRKPKRKSQQKHTIHTNLNPLNVQKEAVENVIDKYVKNLNSREKSPNVVDKEYNNRSNNKKKMMFDDHEQRKWERVKKKALEVMFDTDDEDENENKDKSNKEDNNADQQNSITDDLYEETISLSSDSEIDEENNVVKDGNSKSGPDKNKKLPEKNKSPVIEGAKTPLVNRDAHPKEISVSTGKETSNYTNNQGSVTGATDNVTGNIRVSELLLQNSETKGQNISVVKNNNWRQSRISTRDKFNAHTDWSFGTNSFSQKQTSATQNIPFVSRFTTPNLPPPFTTFNIPPPNSNVPPLIFQAPSPNYLVPSANLALRSPYIPALPFIRYPQVTPVNSVSNPLMVSSQLVDSSQCSQTTQSKSDSASCFLASLPGINPSKSLLTSVPSTVIGTLNKVLDVILNKSTSAERGKETQTVSSAGSGAMLVTSEIVTGENQSQNLRQTEPKYDKSVVPSSSLENEEYKHRSNYGQPPRAPLEPSRSVSPYRHYERDGEWERQGDFERGRERDYMRDRERGSEGERERDYMRERGYEREQGRDFDRMKEYEWERLRERVRDSERERAIDHYYRDVEYDRRRYEYDRYYRDYYFRSRSYDPYYDQPPSRYTDRPYDPYYDDLPPPPRHYADHQRPQREYGIPRRPFREPYHADPLDDPYYSPPPRYEDRCSERSFDSQSRTPTARSVPQHPGLDQISSSYSKQPANVPSLFDIPVKRTDNITKNVQHNISNIQQSAAQVKARTPIVVSRGKRVASAPQQILEKAQAQGMNFGAQDKVEVSGDDNTKPAFCTGLNPQSMEKTGLAYRQTQRKGATYKKE